MTPKSKMVVKIFVANLPRPTFVSATVLSMPFFSHQDYYTGIKLQLEPHLGFNSRENIKILTLN